MTWPSPQDYNEAVQTPSISMDDPELRTAIVETNELGLPRCVSGNFASVYCFANAAQKVAVRCFLHNVPDQAHRYREISKFVLGDDLPYTVPFDYIEKGVNIRGEWFPILKMEWVEGIAINQFVKQNLGNSEALLGLASRFRQMMVDLRVAGIAHGDLQHDNILIVDNEIRLVDYDGMFVPSLSNCAASELGHRNYQHPKRHSDFFDATLDNFSAWVIYSSLQCLAIDPSLWHLFQGGDDCLLFRHADYIAAEGSPELLFLTQHSDPRIRNYALHILHFLRFSAEAVIPIEEDAKTFDSEFVELVNASASAHASRLTSSRESIDHRASLRSRSSAPILKGPSTRLLLHSSITNSGPNAFEETVLAQLAESNVLAKDEVIVWRSSVLPERTWVWDLFCVMLAIVFSIPFFLMFSFLMSGQGSFVLLILLGVWLAVRRYLSVADRMYMVTNARVLIINNEAVQLISFGDISFVKETADDVLLYGPQDLFTQKMGALKPRRMNLEESSVEQFFEALPETIPRERL